MNRAILLLGSNLGNKSYYLKEATRKIEDNDSIELVSKSSVFESEAFGYESTNTYYNLALKISTKLAPQKLLEFCLETESTLARTRSLTQRYNDRTIDIDVILIDDWIIKDVNLTVPHPRMHERLFCLKPVDEIASEWIVPTFNKSVYELLAAVNNKTEVKKVNVEV